MLHRRLSLTLKMLILTASVGLVVWAGTDYYQTRSLSKLFNKKLTARFGQQAEQQRIRFDQFVKRHHQSVKLFISSSGLLNHLSNPDWGHQRTPKIYNTPPPWLPKLSVIRNFIQPRYVLLLDNRGRVREMYQADSKPLPGDLLHPSSFLLELSDNQGYLTTLDGQPYLLAGGVARDRQNRPRATLLMASPLDEQFLLASQGLSLPNTGIIALLSENSDRILVSSNSTLVPPGAALNSLKDRYLMIGQGFFDYGATDTVIVLASFISNSEAEQLTSEVLNTSRRTRGITAILFIAASVLLMFLITRRIQRFTAHVVDFSRSLNLDTSGPQKGDQIHILEENFHRLAEAVQSENAALEHQALHDPLTELPNRKLLHKRIQQELLRKDRRNAPFVLLLSDLNHFKLINDTLGHHIGDRILQQAAERLIHACRRSDCVARLGGDEFGILLPDTTLDSAMNLVQKVVSDFNRPFVVEDHTLSVGISIGIAVHPAHGNDVNILVQRADVAMYVAKRQNTGYAIYDPYKDTHSIGRLALMTEFRAAIEQQQLEIFYQPKIEMYSGRVVGTEALLRWNHPVRGYINPDDFIPLAEQTGLFRPLTRFVLERATRQCMAWKQKGFEITTSVNLSTLNLHDTTLLDQIRGLLSKLDMPAPCLTLEITESDIMIDPVRGREILNQMNRMGVLLSIDDFGTGYSSLSYLKQLPVSELKIDRSFVLEMAQNENDETIVRATIDLAHNLGLHVVAEGVENQSTWKMLRSMRCDIAQGFYVSEPLPGELLTEWLATTRWSINKPSRATK